jgi:hypothetical protein
MRVLLTAAAIAFFAIAAPRSAAAYVRTTTTSGTPLGWGNRCVEWELDGRENPAFSTERLAAAVGRAEDAWRAVAGACPNPFHFSVSPKSADTAAVGRDHHDVILWRLGDYCRRAENADDNLCLAPNVAATTTVFFRDEPGASDDGTLLEADMEINGIAHRFDDGGASDAVDMQSVLVHELGHAAGLDHTCTDATGTIPPTDDLGREVPRCLPVAALPVQARAATMYPFLEPGDVSKRSPGPDEQRAVCAIYRGYPSSCVNEPSESKGACGCRMAGGGERASPVAVGALVAAIARRRSRKRLGSKKGVGT